MKLIRYLCLALDIPRRRAAELLDAELVTVDGDLETSYAREIDPGSQEICYRGKSLTAAPLPETKVFAYHKPKGMVVSLSPRESRLATVLAAMGTAGLRPAGRLDRDSEGLLIVTNDGALLASLIHPRKEIPKYYDVTVRGWQHPYQHQQVLNSWNLQLDAVTPSQTGDVRLLVTLREGRYRQIRRACAGAGLDVVRLVRTAIDGVQLGELAAGKWRELTQNEIMSLRSQIATSLKK